ncbi:hypothetical protein [Paraburkholderia sp. J7]|uniref:hypothetical protein n=1 Tax=Paraburkholderia sp. J7 TaxID=2805438 RepID=UPI002AB6961E|nr:hypothetical protein [Paraburkholderia sp. J7]
MKVVVRIERLVLDTFADQPGEPARLRAALESELARLASDSRAADWRSRATPVVRAPNVRTARGDTPESSGQRIAEGVYAGILGRR